MLKTMENSDKTKPQIDNCGENKTLRLSKQMENNSRRGVTIGENEGEQVADKFCLAR